MTQDYITTGNMVLRGWSVYTALSPKTFFKKETL